LIIKESNSNAAARAYGNLIRDIAQRFDICAHQGHDFALVIYMSSLMISRYTGYSGSIFIDEIANLARLSPTHLVWVVRTTSANHFPGYMRLTQMNAINYLSPIAYLVQYDPNLAFLNHAKFLLSYHVCFSESAAYHGTYFGSTNLTLAGMFHSRNRPGNYEEFQWSYRHRNFLSTRDVPYLEEVESLIRYSVALRSSETITQYVRTHLEYLQRIISAAESTLRGTTTGELFGRYLDLTMAYSQSISFLAELPGRKLTDDIANSIIARHPVPNPFEFEVLDCDEGFSEKIASELGLDKSTTRELVRQGIVAAEDIMKEIRESYLPKIEDIANFRDDAEDQFYQLTQRYAEKHGSYVSRLIELASSSQWHRAA